MYILTELVNEILTSEKGRELLEKVPPVYSDGYVALWLFQIMGLELDTATQYVEDYEKEIMPQTATWSIPLWEDKLGITGNTALTIEQRREAIINALSNKPMNPNKLAKAVSTITGFDVSIIENTGTNKFTLDCAGTVSTDLLARIHRIIDDKKPAHLVFDVQTALVESAPIGHREGAGITLQRTFNLEVS